VVKILWKRDQIGLKRCILGRRESKIPVLHPAISLDDSVHDELPSTPFMAGHASIALDKEIDIGLAELWIVAGEGYRFVAFFTLEYSDFHFQPPRGDNISVHYKLHANFMPTIIYLIISES
jgi:hypothetical protein